MNVCGLCACGALLLSTAPGCAARRGEVLSRRVPADAPDARTLPRADAGNGDGNVTPPDESPADDVAGGEEVADAGSSPEQATGDELNALALGSYHAARIVSGRLYSWGENDSGQLGVGDTASRSLPTRVGDGTNWRAVASGGEHTCALAADGAVACFGAGSAGQLGSGDREGSLAPVSVDLPQPAEALSLGSSHSCAVLRGGDLYCWGHNFEGQVGLGDEYSDDEDLRDVLTPSRVDIEPVSRVSAGNGHTCAVTTAARLYCWGRNSGKESGPFDDIQFRSPREVMEETRWQVVAAGQNHTCGLSEDGSLWCWGENVGGASEGPLGLVVERLAEPTIVSAQRWIGVNTNTFHTCAIDDSRSLWCWGRNIEGQLGLGDSEARSEPTRVQSSVDSVAVGRFFTCLSAGETVACAGANESGQLGTADQERRVTFTSVASGTDP